MRSPIIVTTAATLLVGAHPALAAETLTLDEVVVKGQAASSTRENVEGRDIRETPAKDLGEALRGVPGIDMVRKGPIANDVQLRGQSRDNINVLVDGQRLYGSCSGRMDPPASHIDFGEVERVEILKGPYDLENAGSMAGMINVVTKAPRKGFGADLSLNYGSFQSLAGSTALSYGADGFNGLGGYSYKNGQLPTAGGGRSYADLYPSTSPNAYRPGTTGTAYEHNTAWVKLGLTPGAGIDTRLDYTMQDAQRVLYPGLTMDAVRDTMNRVNWSLAKDNLKVQAYWNSVYHLMDDSYRQSASASGQPTMSTDARSSLMGAKASYAWELGGGVLKVGLDGYSRHWNNITTMKMAMNTMGATSSMHVHGMGTEQGASRGVQAVTNGATSSSIPDVTLRDLGLYGEYAFKPLPALTVKAGLRGDVARTDAAAVDAALLAKFASYYPGAKANTEASELGGNMQATYALSDQVELFGGVARAVRMPDPQEQFQASFSTMGTSWIGNPTLRPSKNHQADLGARYRGDWFNLTASLFGSYVQDYIYVVALDPSGPTAAARSYANNDARMMGGELGAQAALPMNLFLSAGLGYVHAQNATSGNPLAETPPLKGTVALRYDVDSFFVELAENAAATQDRVDPALKETATPGWMTTDLKAGLKWNGATLMAGVNNLFDAYYATNLSYRRDPFSSGVQTPEPGRNVYVGVTYRF